MRRGQVTSTSAATTAARRMTDQTTAAASVGAAAAMPPPSIIGGINQSTSNQGWTVAGNYNLDMAPDVEMRLLIRQFGGATGELKSNDYRSSAV